MKNLLKFATPGTFFLFLLMFVNPGEVSAQKHRDPNEKQVININEVQDFVLFNKKDSIKVNGKVVGYLITKSIGNGHRRSGGCCQFNGGWCGRFSDAVIKIDLNGNITQSSIKMFKGTSDGELYVRFEGLSKKDSMDEPVPVPKTGAAN